MDRSSSGPRALGATAKRRWKRAIWAYRGWRLPSSRLLRTFARTFPEATFVQIGSNDGEQLDPLRASILGRRWRGLMIEPVPYVFERLRANYADVADRITLENVAVADHDGMLPFHHLAAVDDHEAEGLPRWYDALGSFRLEVIRKHVDRIPDLEDRLVTTDVRCSTIDTLCRKHGIDRIDLLHIDTEGSDLEILRTLDWDAFRPTMVIYEHLHLTAAEREEARAYLSARGYGCIEEHMDTCCVHLHGRSGAERQLARHYRRICDEGGAP